MSRNEPKNELKKLLQKRRILAKPGVIDVFDELFPLYVDILRRLRSGHRANINYFMKIF